MKFVSSLVFGLVVLHGITIAESLSSVDFLKLWPQYDTDDNDYIEKTELDNLLLDTFQQNYPGQPFDPATLAQYKQQVLNSIDTNFDGKLSLTETAVLLNVDDNYLMNFNQPALTEDEIVQIFFHYDQNDSLQLDDDEIVGFLYDLLRKSYQDVKYSQVVAYKSALMDIYDTNTNGKLHIQEFAALLPSQ